MKNTVKMNAVKNAVRYMIYVTSVAIACYGFWGCLFPDLTLVEGTYRIVTEAEGLERSEEKVQLYEEPEKVYFGAEDIGQMYQKDKEALYADMLSGKAQVTFRCKLLELFKNRRGH